MAEELIRRIGQIKAVIDNGFSRVGPTLRPGDPVDKELFGAAGRAVRLANAIVLLCGHGHAEEAALLLRALAGSALAMRWIASTGAGGAETTRDWSEIWGDPLWEERLGRAGVSGAEYRRFQAFVSGAAVIGSSSGASGLPWAHKFSEGAGSAVRVDELMGLVVEALEHALGALNARWPKSFSRSS